jgi:phage replication O-like protein O
MTSAPQPASKIIPNSYQSPNWLVDDVMRYLSGNEVKCLNVVCRKTFGWHKRSDRIAKSQLVDLTGMSENTIDDCMAALVRYGLVVRVSENDPANRGVEWAIQENDELVDLAGLRSRFEERSQANRGKVEKASAARNAGGGRPTTPPQPTTTPVVQRPDGGVVQRPPQKTLSKAKEIQEEEKPVPNFGFSQALTDELERAGIYRHNWTDVALYLRAGNSEQDVLAVLAWMREISHGDTSKAAQRFVTRIRERTHAPAKYYPLQAPESVCVGVCVSADDENTADLGESGGDAGECEQFPAWKSALEMLQQEMPKESFRRYVEPCRVLEWREQEGELRIVAENGDACGWLESRLTRTLQRLLAGILNREVRVTWWVSGTVEAGIDVIAEVQP